MSRKGEKIIRKSENVSQGAGIWKGLRCDVFVLL